MSPNDDWEREVSTVGVNRLTMPRRLYLRVIADGTVTTHPLPPVGVLTLGRSEDADIRVQDPSVSRLHARLKVGSQLFLEDLGSQNGTRVGETQLPANKSVEVRSGQYIEIGTVMLVLQVGHDEPGRDPHHVEKLAPEPKRATPSEPGLVVADGAMQAIYRLVDRVAGGDIAVLLLGETGVGKEVVAEAIHRRSPRAKKPFLRINCGALPDNLLESELFGYEKGAFSGADKAKPGLLEAADGGTLLLDEIGELPLALQVKLLRVLDTHMVQRLGALTPKSIDVRLLSATNRDLDDEVEQGRFRADLLFRIDGITIAIPPLRERVMELDALCQLFLAENGAQGLTANAMAALRAHSWPGNVRELKHVLERAALLCTDGLIDVDHLQMRRTKRGPTPAPVVPTKPGALDKETIIAALDRCAGNQKLAAQELGISRGTLVSRLESFGIARPRKRS